MAAGHRLVMDSTAIAQLDEDPDMAELLLEIGHGVAREAAAIARRRTGRGASSIRPWPGHGPGGPHVDVSWDQDHFYMIFHETGTREIAARPVLEPALDTYLHL